jgi:hypothetical protein
MQVSLAGEEIHFLESDSFLAYLESSIATRGARMASVFAVNALIPAGAISRLHSDCKPETLVPFLAKIIRWMLGPSGTVFRVGPGILVCVHLAPRSVDPELIGLQLERSIKRIFALPSEVQDILKGACSYNPETTEAEETLRYFLSNL